MHHTLTDQELTLLSAFHDGEVSASERSEVQRLLERSPEARAWLRDVNSVRTLSIGVYPVAGSAALSGKLSGSAIVAASRGGAPGGSFVNIVRSPFGLAGTAAVLVAGAIVAFNPFGGRDSVSPGDGVATEQVADIAVPAATPVELTAEASLLPPVTPTDLVGFALDGALPIDRDRSRFVGVSQRSEGPAGTETAREIEDGLGSLEPGTKRSLDSLAKLLSGSVVRVENDRIGLRNDIPSLRVSVIRCLMNAKLSDDATERLANAREKAHEDEERLTSALEKEMQGWKKGLIDGGGTPYVFVDAVGTKESFTGTSEFRSVFSVKGNRVRPIIVDPGSVRYAEPEIRIASLEAPSSGKGQPTASKRTLPAERTGPRGDDLGSKKTNVPNPAESNDDAGAKRSVPPSGAVSSSPYGSSFMQTVTISLAASNGMKIIISDDVDTTFRLGPMSSMYLNMIGPEIDQLTRDLNDSVQRVVNDRTRSSRERAMNILQLQSEYEQKLIELIRKKNGPSKEPQDSTEKADEDKGAANIGPQGSDDVSSETTSCGAGLVLDLG